MISRDGTTFNPRRRQWLAAAGVGLPVAALLIYLIAGFHAGLRAQQQARQDNELAHTAAHAVSLDHFLSGLETELTDLADRREVSAYFENAALGMSLEYGLRISLLDLEVEFDKRLKRALPGGAPLLSRLVLLDTADRVVLDSATPRADPGRPWDGSRTLANATSAGDGRPAACYVPASNSVLLVADCRIMDRTVGRLVGVVPVATLHAQLEGSPTPIGEDLWLAWGQNLLTGPDGRGAAPPVWNTAGTPPTGVMVVRGGTHLVSCVRLADFPLTIVRATTVGDTLATNPTVMLWSQILAALVALGLGWNIWRGQLRTQALTARLELEAAYSSEVAAQKIELEREIERRKRVETDLVQARDAAEAASRAKSQFLANMSHEIRTPLNGVLGMTELVLETKLDPEQREHLEISLESGRSLLTVINDVLDMARIEAGAMALAPAPFDPAAEMEAIRRSFLASARAKGLELVWSIDPALAPSLRGDSARLRQVLVNLVGNAIKFTAAGRVGLSVEVLASSARHQAIEFRVDDTGIGIPADKADLIFDAFQQADSSHTRRYGGTGLGLHIANRFVVMMGGRLLLDSREGAGSRFTFCVELPRADVAMAAEPDAAEPFTGEHKRVLVAEDNPVNQKLITLLLRNWGHEFVLAADGVAALDALHRGEFDLALLDLQMPHLDGLDVARCWREHEAATGRPRLPLIALSARVLPSDVELCREAGIDAHVPKPLDSTLLRATIERFTMLALSRS